MSIQRKFTQYYETIDDAEAVGTKYMSAHLCYIGIAKFNKNGGWKNGDSFFDPNHLIPDKYLFGEGPYGSDEVWSTKGKGNKERSALAHLFEGNEGGFHHNTETIGIKGVQFKNKRIIDSLTGVYRVDVIINEKNGPKTYPDRIFFPDNWSRKKVMKSIKEAYRNATYLNGNLFYGTDSNGFPIEFSVDEYFCIMSAYPRYPR
ncbi:hypothetical protein FGG79_21025 [Bacillus sp. BHET2]|uniref:EndoU domain-containing protein n=1 Tax=Bacillus sp. BHET2 TaxID=2583818 RepID=UPI00110DABA2|nr:EndoU domain-containing protein [Bacillus sp. BHET2]TMU82264.1 hypothetical protein FGG79_21025 [Bacillus sp. BHET2]